MKVTKEDVKEAALVWVLAKAEAETTYETADAADVYDAADAAYVAATAEAEAKSAWDKYFKLKREYENESN